MLGVERITFNNKKEQHLSESDIEDASEDSDQCTSYTESQEETDSEPEETKNNPSLGMRHSRPSTIAYGSLSESEEGTSEDPSSELDSNVSQNRGLGKTRRSYKRRRYQENVRAKINKERSTAEWLSYVGAYDAHWKLVDNWGE